MQKYFSIWTRGPDELESEKNGGQKSLTPSIFHLNWKDTKRIIFASLPVYETIHFIWKKQYSNPTLIKKNSN